MNRIRQLREENNMSQKQLAEKLNVHQTAVSQWEQDRTQPGFETANEICNMFDVDLGYLMGFSDVRGHVHLTAQEQEELGRFTVRDLEHEHLQMYHKLDEYGTSVVDEVTKQEFLRCKEQGTLCD